AQAAQLFPPQRRVIGKREHQPLADRLSPEHRQDLQPFGLAGNPRQPDHPRHHPPAAPAAETAPGRVTAPAHRVGFPHALLDQEVIEHRTGTSRCCSVALASSAPESIATTFAPRRLGRDVSSRTNTATSARVAANGSTPPRSHASRYSARPL